MLLIAILTLSIIKISFVFVNINYMLICV